MPEHNQTKLLVLYADDDPDDIQYVRECIMEQADAIQLLTFRDAESLLRSIRTGQIPTLPCLVILDINMPRLNGKEALKMLRDMEGYETVPVVLFSTSNAPHDGHFASQYDAELFAKPLNDEQMQVIAKKFLERCREPVKDRY
jgi:CheY-like chemotaxis protein